MGRGAGCGCRQHLNTPSVQTSPRKPADLEHSREGPHRGPCGRPALWHNTEAIGCNIPHGQPCFLSSSQVLGSLRPRGRPGSRLWPGPALAIVAICGIDQKVQDLFSDFPINKFKKIFTLEITSAYYTQSPTLGRKPTTLRGAVTRGPRRRHACRPDMTLHKLCGPHRTVPENEDFVNVPQVS